MKVGTLGKKENFNDIYWDILYRKKRDLHEELRETFEIRFHNARRPSPDTIFKFEHISLTGGAIVNSQIKEAIGNPAFIIPSFQQIWKSPKIAGPYIPHEETKVLSSHFLNGSCIEVDKQITSFTFIRDPRRLLLSQLQDKKALAILEQDSSKFWRLIEKRLLQIRSHVKHANYQLYELATPNSEKRFPWENEGKNPLYNLENLKGVSPTTLMDKVNKRVSDDLAFIGVTELFSESLVLLFELIGISKLSLWSPGLFSFRKVTIDETPSAIVDLMGELCEAEIDFYTKIKNGIFNDIARSKNGDVISKYKASNKKYDLRYLLSFEERLQLASEVNGMDGERFRIEMDHSNEVVRELIKIINSF